MGRETLSCNLFVKMASEDENGHDISREAKLMEREVGIYQRLLPRLRMLLNIEADHNLLPLSEIIYGAYQETGEGILVAMDLCKDNFSPLDVSSQPPLKSLVTVVENLAKFHAASAAFINKIGLKEFEREFPQVSGSFYDSNGVFNQTMRELQVQTTINSKLNAYVKLIRSFPT